MEPILTILGTSFTKELTSRLFSYAGKEISKFIKGSDQEQAIQRCLDIAIHLMYASASSKLKKDDLNLLSDILVDFFKKEHVIKHISTLLKGGRMDKILMKGYFEEEIDLDTLDEINVEFSLSIFEEAFVNKALEEPSLQSTIMASEMRKHTEFLRKGLEHGREEIGIVRQILDELKKMNSGQISPLKEQMMIEGGKILMNSKVFTLFSEKDTGALRSAYLNSVFTTAQYLSLSGIDPKAAGDAKAALELEAVYTALNTLSGDSHDFMDRKETGGKEIRYLSAIEQVNRCKHLVLLGDPGSGKTTFVNFLALCFSGEALGDGKINLELLTAPLPGVDDKEQKPQPWEHGAILPVRIILRDFAARGLPDKSEKSKCQPPLEFYCGGVEVADPWRFL